MAFRPESGVSTPSPETLGKLDDILTIAKAVAVGQTEGGEVADAIAAYYGSIPDEIFDVLKMPNVESTVRQVIGQYVKEKGGDIDKQDAAEIDRLITERLNKLKSARRKAA